MHQKQTVEQSEAPRLRSTQTCQRILDEGTERLNEERTDFSRNGAGGAGHSGHKNKASLDIPGAAAVRGLPFRAGNMGSTPGLGRFPRLQSNSAWDPTCRACALETESVTEPVCPEPTHLNREQRPFPSLHPEKAQARQQRPSATRNK